MATLQSRPHKGCGDDESLSDYWAGALGRSMTLCPSDLLRKSRTTPCGSANPSAHICFGNPAACRGRAAVSHTLIRHNAENQAPLLRRPAAAWVTRETRCCSYRLCKWQMATDLFLSFLASRQRASPNQSWGSRLTRNDCEGTFTAKALPRSLFSVPYLSVAGIYQMQNAS